MANSEYFKFMKTLVENEEFLAVTGVTQDQKEKQKHFEFLSRFLVHTYVDYEGRLDVEEFIDQGLISLAIANQTLEAETCFKDTFELLHSVFGGDALRRISNGAPSGRVGLSAFECIAIGISRNIKHINGKPDPKAFVKERVEEFWKSPDFDQFFTAGTRGTTRIQKTIPYGQNWFAA